jgi:hypothetical protein
MQATWYFEISTLERIWYVLASICLFLPSSGFFGISSRRLTFNDVKRLVNLCFLIGPHGFIHPLTSKWCWRMTSLSQHELTAAWWSTRNLSSLYIYIHNYTPVYSEWFPTFWWIDMDWHRKSVQISSVPGKCGLSLPEMLRQALQPWKIISQCGIQVGNPRAARMFLFWG